MAVLVKGESGGMVAEVLLHCFHIIARLERGNGVCVAQIVEPLFRKSGGLQRLFSDGEAQSYNSGISPSRW